jgi:hypothetical protein
VVSEFRRTSEVPAFASTSEADSYLELLHQEMRDHPIYTSLYAGACAPANAILGDMWVADGTTWVCTSSDPVRWVVA